MTVLFFDSNCLMCNSFIKLVHKLDKENKIYFSNFHSQIAQNLEITLLDNSMAFYIDGKIYYRSSAFIEILKQIDFPYIIIAIIEIIPLNIRDFIYNIISKNRYILNSFKDNSTCSIEINFKTLK